nr:immunoglobulin heavy chain junction region [Macaca mulatta]MOV35934.1 immunoglobulin heavy chain junction region [Macaca mulatta]MOV36224.1 immunoglobulin heavy chain junction region [Macaca mulatta]MOV36335.1 immunoglobulin heavy chain junction region [Macaca mulatta]MOV36562.1 immunoglobulin heavy chain junction region [Macaca mulatta]
CARAAPYTGSWKDSQGFDFW